MIVSPNLTEEEMDRITDAFLDAVTAEDCTSIGTWGPVEGEDGHMFHFYITKMSDSDEGEQGNGEA